MTADRVMSVDNAGQRPVGPGTIDYGPFVAFTSHARSDVSRGSESTELPSSQASRLPRARWLDARLLVGVLLVVVSMAVGARVVAGADDSVAVWAAGRDLSAGSVLSSDDVVVERVRLLHGESAYLMASAPVVGRSVNRPVARGELLAGSALRTRAADRLEVSVPIRGGHFPADLERNEQVDVYLTPELTSEQKSKGTGCAEPRLVLPSVTVAAVRRADGRLGVSSSGETGIVLSLPRPEAATDAARPGEPGTQAVRALVAAFHAGSVDLVRVSPAGP